MTDLNDREEPLGDRLKLLELVVAHLADRTADIEKLSVATERLSESTEGLDSALREVGKIRERQDDLAETVDKAAADAAAVAPQLNTMVPRRWFWAVVACIACVVVGGFYVHREVTHNHRLICELRTDAHRSC